MRCTKHGASGAEELTFLHICFVCVGALHWLLDRPTVKQNQGHNVKLSITFTLCHILHYASHWFVLDLPVINRAMTRLVRGHSSRGCFPLTWGMVLSQH
jgi:hypothetical protein